jgi:4-hydroxybenzoate polyprenyltransferase
MGYALIMQGVTFINTCEDYKEDRISGIHTFAHVLGIRKTLLLGSILVFIGGVADLVLVLYFKIDLNNIKTISLLLILIFGIFFLGSIINISKNLYLVGISKDPFGLSKKEAFKMRIWFLTTRYPLLFISLLLIF